MNTEEILKCFLPHDLIDNFDLVEIKQSEIEMQLHFDEKFNRPLKSSGSFFESKGFRKAFHINDFPIQNKKVKLCIRKRRWVDKETQKIVSKSYDFKHTGTSYSKGLASFLKDGVR